MRVARLRRVFTVEEVFEVSVVDDDDEGGEKEEEGRYSDKERSRRSLRDFKGKKALTMADEGDMDENEVEQIEETEAEVERKEEEMEEEEEERDCGRCRNCGLLKAESAENSASDSPIESIGEASVGEEEEEVEEEEEETDEENEIVNVIDDDGEREREEWREEPDDGRVVSSIDLELDLNRVVEMRTTTTSQSECEMTPPIDQVIEEEEEEEEAIQTNSISSPSQIVSSSSIENEEAESPSSSSSLRTGSHLRRLIPKWQIRGRGGGSSGVNRGGVNRVRDGTLDPWCTRNNLVIFEGSDGPVHILPHKALKCPGGLDRYRCPVPNCHFGEGSRVHIAKHFNNAHRRNYRSWRDIYLNKDAPRFIVGGRGGEQHRDESDDDDQPLPPSSPPPNSSSSLTSLTQSSWSQVNRPPLCSTTATFPSAFATPAVVTNEQPLLPQSPQPPDISTTAPVEEVVIQGHSVPDTSMPNSVQFVQQQQFGLPYSPMPFPVTSSGNVVPTTIAYVQLPGGQFAAVQGGFGQNVVSQNVAGQFVLGTNGQEMLLQQQSGGNPTMFQYHQQQQQQQPETQKYKIVQVLVPARIANQGTTFLAQRPPMQQQQQQQHMPFQLVPIQSLPFGPLHQQGMPSPCQVSQFLVPVTPPQQNMSHGFFPVQTPAGASSSSGSILRPVPMGVSTVSPHF